MTTTAEELAVKLSLHFGNPRSRVEMVRNAKHRVVYEDDDITPKTREIIFSSKEIANRDTMIVVQNNDGERFIRALSYQEIAEALVDMLGLEK